MNKDLDLDFEEYTITQVTEGGYSDKKPYYSINFDGCGCSFEKTQIVPKVGDIVRLYGKGFGYPIRGVDINGQEVFYRTEEEQKIENKKQVETLREQRHLEYLLNQEKRQKQYHCFPQVFKQRIDGFQSRNENFWEHEDYELFCCSEAIKIAKLGSLEAIQKFHKAGLEEQKLLVPECDLDNHSGNTFGTSCNLARAYLENPEWVPRMHGALCGMVGCDEYKCYSTTLEKNNVTV